MSYFHEAGSLLQDDGNVQPLVARWGPCGLRADGTLIRIHRVAEWPGDRFGEWEPVTRDSLHSFTLQEVSRLVEEVEAMLLLPDKALDVETLWAACHGFAQAASLHNAYFSELLKRFEVVVEDVSMMESTE